ncbi:MAG: GPP34 family phosphoprotein [Alphaproteobacteria bacterium]|nr:GPP34 family phosphoprotein [Alphaproteobacteria bacterium]
MHLGHELLLLHLDDASGVGRLWSYTMAFAYSGAVLAEWLDDGSLVAVEADGFVLARRGSEVASLAAAEACMPEEPRPLRKLIAALYGWNPVNRYRPALEELEAAGCIAPVADRVLGIPWRTRWPEREGHVERALVDRLRRHVGNAGPAMPPHRDDALLSVLRSVRLLESVWQASELERLQPAIHARTRMAPIGRDVRLAIQEHEAAMAVAT